MFNNRSDGYRSHKQDGLPRKLGSYKLRQTEPGSFNDGCKIDLPHKNSSNVSHNDSAENRNQFQQPFGKHAHDNGSYKRNNSQQPVFCSHIHTRSGKRQTDKHDNRANNYGWEQPLDNFHPLPLDECTHQKINSAYGH